MQVANGRKGRVVRQSGASIGNRVIHVPTRGLAADTDGGGWPGRGIAAAHLGSWRAGRAARPCAAGHSWRARDGHQVSLFSRDSLLGKCLFRRSSVPNGGPARPVQVSPARQVWHDHPLGEVPPAVAAPQSSEMLSWARPRHSSALPGHISCRVALESLRHGHGGDLRVAAAQLGMTPATVTKGRKQLLSGDFETDRVRKPGGGRKPLEKSARSSSPRSSKPR